MKKFFVAMSALCLFAAIGTNAMAGESKMKAGVDGAVLLPMSNWADMTSLGIGVLGVFEYRLDKKMVVTGRIGYLHGLEGDMKDYTYSQIPVMGGIKYYFMKDVYAAGEVGLVNNRFDSPEVTIAPGMTYGGTSSQTKLGISAGAGYEMGDLDLRGQLFFPSLGDLGDLMAIMATVGYRFGL